MPLSKLSFKPGINKESTSYANEGTFYDGNWVRFRSGYPEKIGGWQNLSFANTYKGVARSLFAWITHAGEKLLGIGTSQKFYIENGGRYYDITPNRTAEITLGASPLSTTDTSKLVTVTHTAHGAGKGSFVAITSTSSVAGLDIYGEYEIITVIDGNSYTIAAASAANATTTGGGTVKVTYQINAGNSSFATVGGGWGAGAYGSSGWGQSTGAVVSLPLRVWSQCTYGEDLVMAYRSGPIYYWDMDAPTYARAVALSDLANTKAKAQTTATSAGAGTTITVGSTDDIDLGAVVISGTNAAAGCYVTAIDYATKLVTLSVTTAGAASGNYVFSHVGRQVPTKTEAVFSADVSKFTIALGATPYEPGNYATTYNPMLVRWSDQDNIYEWVPDITNQSGEKELSIGSYLVTAQNTRQEILIWSDAALYSMQYLGPPFVFGFNLLADNISIASPNAATTVGNTSYWMGVDKFYVYTGRAEPLPCTLRQHVFGNINRDQMFQIVSGSNEGFNEVWWFYPSANSTVNDRYVIFNYLDNLWYHGELERTGWLDSPLRPSPMAAFSVQTTYMNAVITDSATEISVYSADSYPESGTIVIESEEIAYTSRTTDKFSGCTRGVNNTTAASHSAYTPVSYKTSNQIMYHEVGTDDQSTSIPAPINSYVSSADFDIGDGHNFGFVWRILPDLTFENSTVDSPSVTLTVRPRINSGVNYHSANSPEVVRTATYPIEQFTGQVYTRVRGRQMSFKIESTELGVAWQLGMMRIDIRPDGRRA